MMTFGIGDTVEVKHLQKYGVNDSEGGTAFVRSYDDKKEECLISPDFVLEAARAMENEFITPK